MKKMKLLKWKKILYSVGLAVGIVSSAVSVGLSYRFENNPIVNYFIGFSASLIITILFAWLLEMISLNESNKQLIKRRNVFLLPISEYISSMFIRCQVDFNEKASKDTDFYNCFETSLKQDFSLYCIYIDKLVDNNRDCDLINGAYDFKFGIQVYSVEPLLEVLDTIISQKYYLLAEGLFSRGQIEIIKSFRREVDMLKLPYMDVLSRDRNIAHENIDWPKEPVNDLVRQNYNTAIVGFIHSLKTMTHEFDELKSIERIGINFMKSKK